MFRHNNMCSRVGVRSSQAEFTRFRGFVYGVWQEYGSHRARPLYWKRSAFSPGLHAEAAPALSFVKVSWQRATPLSFGTLVGRTVSRIWHAMRKPKIFQKVWLPEKTTIVQRKLDVSTQMPGYGWQNQVYSQRPVWWEPKVHIMQKKSPPHLFQLRTSTSRSKQRGGSKTTVAKNHLYSQDWTAVILKTLYRTTPKRVETAQAIYHLQDVVIFHFSSRWIGKHEPLFSRAEFWRACPSIKTNDPRLYRMQHATQLRNNK